MTERMYLEVVLRAEPHELRHRLLAEAKADLYRHVERGGNKGDIDVRFRRTLWGFIPLPQGCGGGLGAFDSVGGHHHPATTVLHARGRNFTISSTP